MGTELSVPAVSLGRRCCAVQPWDPSRTDCCHPSSMTSISLCRGTRHVLVQIHCPAQRMKQEVSAGIPKCLGKLDSLDNPDACPVCVHTYPHTQVSDKFITSCFLLHLLRSVPCTPVLKDFPRSCLPKAGPVLSHSSKSIIETLEGFKPEAEAQ